MAERGGFKFHPWGRGNPRRRGMGRGRGVGWSGSRGSYRYQSPQNQNRFGQPPQTTRSIDGPNSEGKHLSPRERFHTLLKLEVGGDSNKSTKEEVISPGSSSSSKRSCTEMEEDESKTKVLIKKRCKKNLAGSFTCSRDGDGIAKEKWTGEELSNVVMSGTEDWDEEIKTDQLLRVKSTVKDGSDWEKGRFDNVKTNSEKIDGLMLVQESYPSPVKNGTEQSKSPEGNVWKPTDDKVKQTLPRKFTRDKVVENLSNAVTENCTCTSEEDILKSPAKRQNHDLNRSLDGRSFSSPTAGSKLAPRFPSKSKSDSWTTSVVTQGSAKKKGKLKKKHRAAMIPEYEGSTDDDAESYKIPVFHKGERSKAYRPKKDCSASKHLKEVEMQDNFAGAGEEKSSETEVGVVGPSDKEACINKEDDNDGDSCQADDSLTDDESWNNVVKKLSADGVDAEEVQVRQQLPQGNDHTDASMMDAPLSFRRDFRARFSYPAPTYMAYNPNHPSMTPPYPYGPPMWPMVGDPYFYGPPLMRGFHPAAIARYPSIHRYPRPIRPEAVNFPPSASVQSTGNDFQDSYYPVDDSNSESREYLQNSNTAFDASMYGGTEYKSQEQVTCEDNTYNEDVFVSDFDTSGNQLFLSQEDETWTRSQNISWEEKKSPLLQTPLQDIQEDSENFDTQSSFISTEDESSLYHQNPSEPASRAPFSEFQAGMDMDSNEQPNHDWYNDGMETPATAVGPTRRKSKVWGLSLKQMTRDRPGQQHVEARSYLSGPNKALHPTTPPPSSYAAVVSSKNRTEYPGGLGRGKIISNAHLEERRRQSFPGVQAPKSGWGSRHSLVEFVRPQNNDGTIKEKPKESHFWQGTPSPDASETENKFRRWSVGAQGWSSYNLTPVPQPISAPPKPKTFSEILQRPRRLTLEDEVRGQTLPKTASWPSSKEVEDPTEIQYPTSDIDYIDSHAHIDLLFQRQMFKGTFAKFCSENKFPTNFAGCVAIFCYPINFSNHYTLADNLLQESNIWGSFGCHPHQVKHYDGIMEQRIKDWMNHPKTVALGEIGLDYSNRPQETTSDHDLQKMIFRRQLQIALDTKKPLVIHCRDAEADTLSIMTEMVPRNHKIHRHCFTGPPEDAITFLRAFPNSFIGLTALVTFPTAYNTHQTAKAIPLNRLLLETDTPYFVPRKIRGHRWSHPGMALLVAERIAQLRGTTLDDVLSNVRSNTMTMYGV